MNTPTPLRNSLRAAVGAWLASALLATAAWAQTPAAPLSNQACLDCHAASAAKIEVEDDDADEARELKALDPTAFQAGVHAKMDCVACHTGLVTLPAQGQKHPESELAGPAPSCVSCHEDLLQKAGGNASDGLKSVQRNIEAWKKSFHARPNADHPDQPNASCDSCHSSHTFQRAEPGTPAHDALRLKISENCGSCHEDQLESYAESIHGEKIAEGDAKAATCADCHTAHDVGNTSAKGFKLAIVKDCGNCHEDKLKTYIDTHHGAINTLGYDNTAKCYDCHGSHDILKADNPDSKVHPDNRLEMCQECHNGKKVGLATAGYASYHPHGHGGDFEKYPEIWAAWKLMIGLLVGTFGFFWLHTLLWFYREWKERQLKAQQPHVEDTDPVMIRYRGKHVRRFSATWRIAHITFALSLMVLTLTGIPLFYPEAPWASGLMTLLGGPEVAGTIHRVCAVIFAGVFFWHLVYVAYRLARTWKTFKIFGPESLVPNLQDGKDMLAMFKWFFGMGPRPQFDRWAYWEKFDYWAPFWGVTIIGVSGLIMWLPNFFGQFLPGWAFNVAAIFHGEEAFLAVVFLFTVHFFNNHFRPDKFPVEVVMFTGSFSLEEFKHEHALEYKRLVESGELDQYIVDAPSPGALQRWRWVGFVLIACGLTLLTLVGVGFFHAL